MIRSLKRRIEELEDHNEVLLEKFTQAVACDEELGAIKEDRDVLSQLIESSKRLIASSMSNHHESLDAWTRHNSKASMAATAAATTGDGPVNATTATVPSRRRDLRSSSSTPIPTTPRSQSLSIPGPTALIPSPA
ncbi:MAG: hypothetical protein SGARI_000648 [Bacillariaceae sp.]